MIDTDTDIIFTNIKIKSLLPLLPLLPLVLWIIRFQKLNMHHES